MSGVIALAAALKDSKITHLKYVCHSSASHALCFLGYGKEPGFTHFETSEHLDCHLCAHSLEKNYLTHGSNMSGVIALAEALKDTKITDLK